METSHDESKLLRNNLLFVIALSSLVGLLIFAISFLMYYNSDTRKTIEQIQANNISLQEAQKTTTIDDANFSPASIDELQNSIEKDFESLDEQTDFSVDQLTDSSLGL